MHACMRQKVANPRKLNPQTVSNGCTMDYMVITHGPRPKNDKLGPRQNFGLKHTILKIFF